MYNIAHRLFFSAEPLTNAQKFDKMNLTYKECVRDKPCDRRQPTERQGANA